MIALDQPRSGPDLFTATVRLSPDGQILEENSVGDVEMRSLLGAHMSVAGGLPRAVERAIVHRCDALQIFAKNASQWRGRPLPPEEIREFRARSTHRASGRWYRTRAI